MAQLALYVDDETLRKLDERVRVEGGSRSAWVREAILARLTNRLPESFFDTIGAWEDERSPDEILADIRSGGADTIREPLR